MKLSFLEKLKKELEADVTVEKEPEEKAKKVSRKETKKKEIHQTKASQLAIDVYQTDTEIVIITPIARVKPEDLDVSIENDTLTIKGKRSAPEIEKQAKEFLYQECHWGEFSRQVILPEKVDESGASASLKEGVLILRLPKLEQKKRKKIVVQEVKSE